jgi:hypothetical protein
MTLQATSAWLDSLSAADASEYFLSPFIDARLLCAVTANEGPSLWIVNRSDVYDSTLEALSKHSLESIAARAKDKLARRRTQLVLLEAPILDIPIEQIPDYAIEDYLGHPLAPFELILFFMKHLSADTRASACLSLTRRLLEHPPNWLGHEPLKAQLTERASERLLDEPSDFVRLYAARIPLLSSAALTEAFRVEKHFMIRRRLLQNLATPVALSQMAIDSSDQEFEIKVTALLDQRLDRHTAAKSAGGARSLSAEQLRIVQEIVDFRSQL